MSWMVLHPKLFLDHGCHSLRCPHISSEAVGFGALIEQGGQLRFLFGTQSAGWSLRHVSAQSLFALLSPDRDPLAHRPLAGLQDLGYFLLLPTCLPQFPRAQPAPFFPISSVFVCSSHASSLRGFTKSG